MSVGIMFDMVSYFLFICYLWQDFHFDPIDMLFSQRVHRVAIKLKEKVN